MIPFLLTCGTSTAVRAEARSSRADMSLSEYSVRVVGEESMTCQVVTS